MTSEVKTRTDDPERSIQFEVQLKALLAKLGGEGKRQLEEEMKYISQKQKHGSGSGESGEDGTGRGRRSRSRVKKGRGEGRSRDKQRDSSKKNPSKQDMKKKHKVVFNYYCSQLALF